MTHRIDLQRLTTLVRTRAYRSGVAVFASPLGGWFMARPQHARGGA